MNNNKKTQTTNWIICTGKASNGYQQLNISQKTATTKNINNMKNIKKREKKHQQQIGSPLLAAIYAFYQQINIGTVS